MPLKLSNIPFSTSCPHDIPKTGHRIKPSPFSIECQLLPLSFEISDAVFPTYELSIYKLFLIIFAFVFYCMVLYGIHSLEDFLKNIIDNINAYLFLILGIYLLISGVITYLFPKYRFMNSRSFLHKFQYRRKKISQNQIVQNFASGLMITDISIYYIVQGMICISMFYLSLLFKPFFSEHGLLTLIISYPVTVISILPYLSFKEYEANIDEIFQVDAIVDQYEQPTSFHANISIKKEWSVNKTLLSIFLIIGMVIISNFQSLYSIPSIIGYILLISTVLGLIVMGNTPYAYPFIKNKLLWRKNIKGLKNLLSVSMIIFTLIILVIIYYMQLASQ